MSSEALVAAVGLSDFVSIHLTFICLPSTPPALLICSIRIWKSWPACRSYGPRMPVLAAEIPIRIVSAFGAALAETENAVVPIAASATASPTM